MCLFSGISSRPSVKQWGQPNPEDVSNMKFREHMAERANKRKFNPKQEGGKHNSPHFKDKLMQDTKKVHTNDLLPVLLFFLYVFLLVF